MARGRKQQQIIEQQTVSVKILLSGYYGFGNLGDEALLAGLLSALRPAFGPDLRVLSQHPEKTRTLHGVGAVHRLYGLPRLLGPSVLISGGGGLLQDKTSARSLHYYLGLIQLAKRLRHRVIVYGQSVGPLSAEGERAVAQALRNVPIAVRDRRSQELLARLELPSILVADSALLLPKPKGKPQATAPVVLIPRGGYPEITKALKALAQKLHAEDIPLAGLALHPEEDAAPLAELRAQVPTLDILEADTPQEALAHLACSRHVVSARLHGLILAARSRRPFSGIAYDPKVAAFMEEVGGRAYPLTVDPQALQADIDTPALSWKAIAALEARAEKGAAWLHDQLNAARASRP